MKKDIFGIPGLFGSKTFVDGKGSVVGGSTKDIWEMMCTWTLKAITQAAVVRAFSG